ncbi:MAG TPA: hypothetical protein PKE45_11660 [Caldilineaceae bacterium]|nr:hypothetical protein [Caldilineaceae bacterium]
MTPAQLKAIETLLTTGNMTQAAAAAGIHRSTLYKWTKDDSFIGALREAEAEAVAALSRTLAGLGASAGDALRAALQPDVKITVRLRASEIVVTNLLRLRELVEIERRLAALEQANENN